MTDDLTPPHWGAQELLPCPFCGGSFKMAREPRNNGAVGGMFYIFHNYGPLDSAARRCLIRVERHFETEAEAIAAWNTRSRPEPTDPLVEVCDEVNRTGCETPEAAAEAFRTALAARNGRIVFDGSESE